MYLQKTKNSSLVTFPLSHVPDFHLTLETQVKLAKTLPRWEVTEE